MAGSWLEDDIDRMLSADEFAVACSFTVGTGTAAVVHAFNGIFDSDFVDVLGVEGTQPRITARTSEVAAINDGMPVIVATTTYTVRSKEHDGTGVTALVLEET